tara:strand:- start:855 stop:1760 length:906 start_codon:yes stop_codon:yes gene_type:complete
LKILVVIVTHNRLKELKRCIAYVNKQTLNKKELLVIDNNSTDDTQNFLKKNNIPSIYSDKNIGSAGGWNLGINYALENSYDFIWVMDDDGYPHQEALENLYSCFVKSDNIACISSLVVDQNNTEKLAIPLPILKKNKLPIIFKTRRKIYFINDKKLKENNFYEYANFFNGALIKIEYIRKVGNINTSFFLYGEEVDYFFRLREVGKVLTYNNAIHYHPSINKPWTLIKIYFYIKNSIYLNYKYFDYPFVRSILNIFVIFLRVLKNNGIVFFIKLFILQNFKILIKAIYRGFNKKIGNDYDK